MKNLRKVFSLLIAVILVSSIVLSGCGQTETQQPQETPKNSASATPGSTNVEPELEYVELNMVFPFSGTKTQEAMDEVEAEVNKYVKEKFNCSLDLVPLDWAQDPMNQITLMITSGEKADIVFTAGFGGFFANAAKGAYAPLDDLLDKYGAELKSQIDPRYLDGPVVNGKLYGIPTHKEIAEGSIISIDKEIADRNKIDINTIKCIDDLEPYLEVIKQNEPNIYPHFIGDFNADADVQYCRFTNRTGTENYDKFETIPGAGYLLLDIEKGQVVSKYDVSFEKDRYELMRRWYEKGYINKDAQATNIRTEDLAKEGRIWFSVTTNKPGADKESKIITGRDAYTIALVAPRVTTNQTTGAMLSISKNCENPDRAMMIINALHTDKYLENLIIYGIENKHYQKVDDMTIKLMDGHNTKDDSGYGSQLNWQIGSVFTQYKYDTENDTKYDDYKSFNESAEASPLLGFVVDMEPVKSEHAAIGTATDSYDRMLIAGLADDVAGTMAEAREKAVANGLDKVIAEVQRQYEAWVEANK